MTNRRRVDITIKGAWIEVLDGRQTSLYVRPDGGLENRLGPFWSENYLGAFWSERTEGTSTTLTVTDAPVMASEAEQVWGTDIIVQEGDYYYHLLDGDYVNASGTALVAPIDPDADDVLGCRLVCRLAPGETITTPGWIDGDVVSGLSQTWHRLNGQWYRSDGSCYPYGDQGVTGFLLAGAATAVIRGGQIVEAQS